MGNVNAEDMFGQTPLDVAVEYGRNDIVQLLREFNEGTLKRVSHSFFCSSYIIACHQKGPGTGIILYILGSFLEFSLYACSWLDPTG